MNQTRRTVLGWLGLAPLVATIPAAVAQASPEAFDCTLQWHSGLAATGDAAYLRTLEVLSTHGVPIPLRVLASAAGVGAEDERLLHQLMGVPA